MSAPLPKHQFTFDPSYGYSLEGLLSVPAPSAPPDFASFWESTYAETRKIDLALTQREVASPHPDYQLFEVEFNSLGMVRIGAWLSLPRDPACQVGGWVVGHGYGGREASSFELPGPAAPALFPCARGFHRSARSDIPELAAGHVLHGITHRDTYSHRGCVADLWCAASALLELCPVAGENLRYYGGSFGGGIGALALPWDQRFQAGFLDIPSFGNHPLRVQLPCVGSGESVRKYHATHPEVMDVLAYFDAASAASLISIPVFVAAARFDPAVPPPGQFAIYNALAGEKELFVRSVAHFPCPTEVTESRTLQPILGKWFAQVSPTTRVDQN